MTDTIRSDDADSGRTATDKQQAELLATSGPDNDPDVFLVEYPDGEQCYEPATPTNVALFEDGLYGEIQGYSAWDTRIGSSTIRVELDADIEHRDYVLTVDGHDLPIPDDSVEDMFDCIRDNRGAARASCLYTLYQDIVADQVRRHVIEQFEGLYPDERVEITPSGWVIDDTFVVNYEAENYLLDNETVYIRQSGDMVEADERKQAVELGFSITDSAEIANDDGDRVMVSEQEQRFLATVECLLFPSDYLGADLVDGIEQATAESHIEGIESVAETASVSGFTDTKTGNHHGHGFDKHRAISEAIAGDLDNTLGMTQDAIDKLYFNDYDHAACHEILARRDEFENAPFDVFEDDAENDDATRWKAIERAKNQAPINERHREQINEMFGDDDQQPSLNQF